MLVSAPRLHFVILRVGQSPRVSHPCLVRLSLVQRLATAYPSLMFALILSTPSFGFPKFSLTLTDLAFACSCFVPSFVITHTLISGYPAFFADATYQRTIVYFRDSNLLPPSPLLHFVS